MVCTARVALCVCVLVCAPVCLQFDAQITKMHTRTRTRRFAMSAPRLCRHGIMCTLELLHELSKGCRGSTLARRSHLHTGTLRPRANNEPVIPRLPACARTSPATIHTHTNMYARTFTFADTLNTKRIIPRSSACSAPDTFCVRWIFLCLRACVLVCVCEYVRALVFVRLCV